MLEKSSDSPRKIFGYAKTGRPEILGKTVKSSICFFKFRQPWSQEPAACHETKKVQLQALKLARASFLPVAVVAAGIIELCLYGACLILTWQLMQQKLRVLLVKAIP